MVRSHFASDIGIWFKIVFCRSLLRFQTNNWTLIRTHTSKSELYNYSKLNSKVQIITILNCIRTTNSWRAKPKWIIFDRIEASLNPFWFRISILDFQIDIISRACCLFSQYHNIITWYHKSNDQRFGSHSKYTQTQNERITDRLLVADACSHFRYFCTTIWIFKRIFCKFQ